MSQEAQTAIFTTLSGVIGGITKAVSAKPLLLAITFGGLSTVVIYASASAAAGYVVKYMILENAPLLGGDFFVNFVYI
jgi:hypothetical protein